MRYNIKTLNNRISELENKFNKIENDIITEDSSNNYTIFSKKLINYAILSKKLIKIADFNTIKNKNLYFNGQISVSLQANQKIEINTYINDKKIYSTIKSIISGEQEITFMCNYIPPKNEEVNFYIEITSLDNILITVKNITLYVFGLSSNILKPEYQIAETTDKYIFSIISNELLYYKFVPKSLTKLSIQNFNLYKSARSHCFVYITNSNKLLLFRVDVSGRLFYSDFNVGNEEFIDSEISCVSAATNDEKTIVCFVKNGNCYYTELNNLGTINNINKVTVNLSSINHCYIYFNKYNNKFYILLTDKNESNYLIESLEENASASNNINVSYSISATSYNLEDSYEI